MKIVTVIAVFAALVSTAWAAGLAKNSVKSKQLKDNSVQSIDIADGSLSAVDVADGSLGTTELDPSLRTSTLAAHPSFPTDASTVDVITIPGVGTVLGRCTPTIVGIGYSNRSASEQSVAELVRPATGGAGGTLPSSRRMYRTHLADTSSRRSRSANEGCGRRAARRYSRVFAHDVASIGNNGGL